MGGNEDAMKLLILHRRLYFLCIGVFLTGIYNAFSFFINIQIMICESLSKIKNIPQA